MFGEMQAKAYPRALSVGIVNPTRMELS